MVAVLVGAGGRPAGPFAVVVGEAPAQDQFQRVGQGQPERAVAGGLLGVVALGELGVGIVPFRLRYMADVMDADGRDPGRAGADPVERVLVVEVAGADHGFVLASE
ncbi:hypothetical protein D9M70_533540 [compost metagenome]